MIERDDVLGGIISGVNTSTYKGVVGITISVPNGRKFEIVGDIWIEEVE